MSFSVNDYTAKINATLSLKANFSRFSWPLFGLIFPM